MPGIENVKKEYEEILQQLSDPELISNTQTPAKRGEERSSSTWDKGDESKDSSSSSASARTFEELLKRKNYLEKVIEKTKELDDIKNRIEENKEILKSKDDLELVSLAETETGQLQEREKILEKELDKLIEAKSQPLSGEKNTRGGSVIVEIRAGAGGEEAALFVGDLFKMYSKYAQLQGWGQKTLDSRPSELGGFKEIVFELKDGDVFSKMQFEGGVHRVQRTPETEKQGRIHTSTASVAVLLKPKEKELKLSPADLKIDVYKSSGPGGQYVNKRMTAVRITHLPSGLIVTSQTERNLQQNKINAISILGAKLLEKKIMDEEEKMGDKRKTQIGRAKRAEKIRTYNFPQDRITDHRIKKSFHNIEKIMEGELDSIIDSLQSA